MPSADPKRVPEINPFYTKTTYNSLSELIVSETTRAQENGRYGPEAIERLTDALFQAPRLTQWHEAPRRDSDSMAYELWAKDDVMHVTVTEDEVRVTKGIRNFSVIKGLQAATLHKAIATAQEILKPVQPIAEADAEEFFGGPSDADGSDLDAALADSPAGDAKPEGYFSTGDPDDEEELATIIGDAVETVEAESHTLDANLAANLETAEAAEEFEGNPNQAFEPQPKQRNTVAVKDRPKDPKQGSGWTNFDRTDAVQHLKSLQGRILNIAEASFSDKSQREAVKTLINKEFRREITKASGGSHEA